jgi:hypothetical protein
MKTYQMPNQLRNSFPYKELDLLPCSQDPATCPYPERHEISPRPMSLFYLQIVPCYLLAGLPSGLFPSDFPIKILHELLKSSDLIHASQISFPLI